MSHENDVASLQSRIAAAVQVALNYGGANGERHKAWVIDQMVRKLSGEQYDKVMMLLHVEGYTWDEGVPP
jgi:hypothetical protein